MKLNSLVGKVIRLAVDAILKRIDVQEVENKAVTAAAESVDMDALKDKVLEEFDIDDLTDTIVEKATEDIDWSDHIDHSDVAEAVDLRRLSQHIDMEDMASQMDSDVFARHVAENIDYKSLGEKLDYRQLSENISPLEALAGSEVDDVEPTFKGIPESLVNRFLDKAVNALLAAANDAIEKEEQHSEAAK
jgi:hypothetical protein